MRHGLADYFCIPDRFLMWAVGIYFAGVRRWVGRRPDVIYASSPTPSAALAGLALKWTLGCPLVLEYRDLWLGNPFRRPRPLAWVERFEAALERLVLRHVEALVVVSEPMKQSLLSLYPFLPADSVHVIPNGFDLDDFKNLTPTKFEKTTILHAGNFYENRSPLPMLQALRAYLDKAGPTAVQSLQVVFAGRPDPTVESQILALGLGEVVRQIGMVGHTQMLEMMSGADILLLIPGPGAGTMTGKIFEYIAAGKDILAIAGPGCVRDLVIQHALGEVADPVAPEAIEIALEALLENARAGTGPSSDRTWTEAYSREAVARRVSELLDATCGHDAFQCRV